MSDTTTEWPAQFRFVTDPDDSGGWFLRFWWHHAASMFELGPEVVTAMENETNWGMIGGNRRQDNE